MESVQVLLSTYNGERFLPELLQSLYAQQDAVLRLLVRDDASADATPDLLASEAKEGRLRWYTGERLGPARSFLDLLKKAPDSDWYAFCDQDDVWLPENLSRAGETLAGADPSKPRLYYGRPHLVDAALRPLPDTHHSRDRTSAFAPALVFSNAVGCTMVFDRKLRDLAARTDPPELLMHDDWLHKLCLLYGGSLFFDENVPILYRQHDENTMGPPLTARESLRRHWCRLLHGDCVRSRTARSLLSCCGKDMKPGDRRAAERAAYYKKSLLRRILLAFDPAFRTGYWQRDAFFILAVLLKAY